MNKYTIYCSKEQTERAYKLGAPIEEVCTCESPHEYYVREGLFIVAPTAEQVCGWLREKDIHIQTMVYGDCHYQTAIYKLHSFDDAEYTDEDISSYKDAILSAIDIALDYLEKGGNK